MPELLPASQYKRRTDLEKYVRNNIGLTADLKTGYLIQGTDEELARLQLADGSLFWGIRCSSVTQKPPDPPQEEVASRGATTPSGLNGLAPNGTPT